MSTSPSFEPSKIQLRHNPLYYVKPGPDEKEKLKSRLHILENQEIRQCFREIEDEPGADETTINNAIARKKALLMDGITVDASLHDLVCVFVDIPERSSLKTRQCLLGSREELQKKLGTVGHQLVESQLVEDQPFDALVPTSPVEDGFVRICYNFYTKAKNGGELYEELLGLVNTYLGKRLADSDLPVILGDELRVAQTEPTLWELERGYHHERNPLGVSKEVFSPAWKRAMERERTR
ncbi:hypothetical protein P875_00034189 [Aspergillus parasiticus SU-1]|uniref:Uncharacterized protein n=1 Tax=Aspergillus parasiticus (strain ATCC 56775 / NRRL 5862 / SRRC 143 / SU-1) TaxID=1403190 RepID=A0A0F0I8H3_ASPPU|nr:hypothetical protein P875_00034189 [Aspergillus parasiticus SU-1]